MQKTTLLPSNRGYLQLQLASFLYCKVESKTAKNIPMTTKVFLVLIDQPFKSNQELIEYSAATMVAL